MVSGGCLCGHVRYACEEPPLFTAICHCRHCQKQSGSAYSIFCAVLRSTFTVAGTTTVFVDRGDSGGLVHRRFCSSCGSPLYSEVASTPSLVFIKAGTLDSFRSVEPTFQIYSENALSWAILREVQAFDRMRPTPNT